jgi:hypothetical protein
MFVEAVFNGALCRVFDPAVRPGMPRLGLVVSNASSPAGVAAAVAGEVRTATADEPNGKPATTTISLRPSDRGPTASSTRIR